jgi:hypothetical protein
MHLMCHVWLNQADAGLASVDPVVCQTVGRNGVGDCWIAAGRRLQAASATYRALSPVTKAKLEVYYAVCACIWFDSTKFDPIIYGIVLYCIAFHLHDMRGFQQQRSLLMKFIIRACPGGFSIPVRYVCVMTLSNDSSLQMMLPP